MTIHLPSGRMIPGNSIFMSTPGNEFAWFEHVFGAGQRDTHVKAWTHHQFRLSDGGRAMMRNRLKATYPGADLADAHRLYAANRPTYHFDERYV